MANLAHLLRVEVLDLLLILEKLLHSPHLLHHSAELLELVKQGVHLQIKCQPNLIYSNMIALLELKSWK